MIQGMKWCFPRPQKNSFPPTLNVLLEGHFRCLLKRHAYVFCFLPGFSLFFSGSFPAFLNSQMALPKAFPISGSFAAPKRIRIIKSIAVISQNPMPVIFSPRPLSILELRYRILVPRRLTGIEHVLYLNHAKCYFLLNAKNRFMRLR